MYRHGDDRLLVLLWSSVRLTFPPLRKPSPPCLVPSSTRTLTVTVQPWSCDLQTHLQHPVVSDDDASSRGSCSELVDASELSVDAGRNRTPAQERRLRVGPQSQADGMVSPLMTGPVEDKRPAGQMETDRQEDKSLPTAAELRGRHRGLG